MTCATDAYLRITSGSSNGSIAFRTLASDRPFGTEHEDRKKEELLAIIARTKLVSAASFVPFDLERCQTIYMRKQAPSDAIAYSGFLHPFNETEVRMSYPVYSIDTANGNWRNKPPAQLATISTAFAQDPSTRVLSIICDSGSIVLMKELVEIEV